MTVLDALGPLFALDARPEPIGPVEQAVIALLCLGIGGVLALVGVGYVRTYNRVRKTDPVPIRRLSDTDTEVELSGTARIHEETSVSPFTDTECIAHDWKVRKYDPEGSTSNWFTLDSGGTRHPFRFDDGTGTVLVDPGGATLELTNGTTIEIRPDESPPPAVDTYLEETDRIDREHDDKREYTEARLEPGDDTHVFGPVRRVGHSVDMPGGADAIIGLDAADEESAGSGLSELVDRVKTDTMRFTITTGDEREAERHLLKRGLIIAGFGLLFALVPILLVVLV